mmetsp:Transcript_7258/g.13374  ORF Transcript_7258/g.13374 Transcript_7258/m.13374 type:complete len:317 (-) Transcript_7258:89-1039(-)
MCRSSDSFYQKPEPFRGEVHGLVSKFVDVRHSEETLKKVQDKQGLGTGSVRIHYATQQAKEGASHVVLIHATGTTCKLFTTGEENLVSLFTAAGYCVTLVDLRGHGLSELVPGPVSIRLLAADVAEALKVAHPGVSYHVVGVSVGFGTSMALAADYPELCTSLNGNGFLFDRSKREFAVYLFSRGLLLRMLGMRRISKLVAFSLHTTEARQAATLMPPVPLEGYIAVSKSWLGFNLHPMLHNFQVPTCILHPEYDSRLGHTETRHKKELAMMPKDLPTKFVHFPKYSHIMCIEKGGAKLMFDVWHEFMQEAESRKR